jgi:hypothetical protein
VGVMINSSTARFTPAANLIFKNLITCWGVPITLDHDGVCQ